MKAFIDSVNFFSLFLCINFYVNVTHNAVALIMCLISLCLIYIIFILLYKEKKYKEIVGYF